ncbi:MAG TPA: DUF4340 domain-containing protein [Bacteroidota bacterium]|nr:DUF4340 domain-containing protein [Bacteroidota bacterium]
MNRSTLYLILLLVVLGAIVLFLLPSDKERETSYAPSDVRFTVDSASVVKIDIQRQGKSVTLENIGGKWTITQPIRYAADRAGVEQLLSGLAKFKVGSLISSNPEKQGLFQVDSSGTRLSVTDRSSKTSAVILGKMGPSFSEIYFRLPESKDVYLGEGIESWSITKDVKEWRDKSILSAHAEGIRELTFGVGSAEYNFRRDSSGWKTQDRPVDAGTINSSLNSLANLRADDFVDSAVAPAGKPVSIQVKGAEPASLSLFPAADSSKYYVQLPGSKSTFVITKWTAQQLLKPVEAQAMPFHPGVAAVPSKLPARKVAEAIQKPAPAVQKPAPAVQKPVVTKPPVTRQNAPPVQRPVVKSTEPAATTPKTVTKNTDTTPAPAGKRTPPAVPQAGGPLAKQNQAAPVTNDDEGDLTVYTVGKNETMTLIAKKFNVSVEQILKWNLLKSIAVKPGQELYIYQRKK